MKVYWESTEDEVARRPISADDILGYERRAIVTPLEKYIKDQGKELPSEIAHHLKDLAYEIVRFGIGIKTPRGYKWPNSVSIDYKLISTQFVDIDDGLPDEKWADSNLEVNVDVGVRFKDFFKFWLPGKKEAPNAGGEPAKPGEVDTGIKLTFKWNPKIAEIQSVHKGLTGQWRYHHAPGKGVDGDLDLALLIKRDHPNKEIQLLLKEIRVVYQRDFLLTDTAVIEDLVIPFHFASE